MLSGSITDNRIASPLASGATDTARSAMQSLDRTDAVLSEIAIETNPVRQGSLLAKLDGLTGSRDASRAAMLGGTTMMAQASAPTAPGGASIRLDSIDVPDPGKIAVPLSRLGVFGAILTLSGDTPQPTRVDLGGGVQLNVSHDQKNAWFTKDDGALIDLGSVKFMPFTKYLDTPVTVQNGEIRFDPARLQTELGGTLPPGVVAMARPQGVPPALQTTPSGVATAMAGAPDPCRDLNGQRHHIIPAQVMGANQQFLTRIGFKLDQGANMMRLPESQQQRADMQQMCGETRPLHSGRHPNAYGQAISDKLTQIESRNLPAAQSRAQVGRLMDTIRHEISTGGYANINDPRLAQFIRNLNI